MDETINLTPAESEPDAVEVQFGDVVNFIYDGVKRDKAHVVIDATDPTFISCAAIIDESDDNPHLAGAGTHRDPVEVIGNWPMSKVIKGTIRHFCQADGKVLPAIQEIAENTLTDYSKKPPVAYTGNRHKLNSE